MKIIESKIDIFKAGDNHLKTYINLVKMKGITSPKEKELFDYAQGEHARRILMRTLNSKNIGEERIDELRASTLQSYREKATKHSLKLRKKVEASERKYSGKKPEENQKAYKTYDRNFKKMVKRDKGIAKATDRLEGPAGTLKHHWGQPNPSRRTKTGQYVKYNQESFSPTNSMGSSSTLSGPVQTYDPLLFRKFLEKNPKLISKKTHRLKRFKDVTK